MIKRHIKQRIKEHLFKGKAIIIEGPRQVGKTTLVKKLMSELDTNSLFVSGDESDIRELFGQKTITELKVYLGNTKLLVIDEAQRIENIGMVIKRLVDNLPDIQIIATGSSSLELANRINEPLTGRKIDYRLYPISFSEMTSTSNRIEENRLLEHRMVYGYYPEVVINMGREKDILKSIATSYMYKDLFDWKTIKKPALLNKLLQLLALQIGHQVSYNELSKTIGMDKETVERYIDLLEKSYVIFSLNSLSRNMRTELKKSKKIYFYDTGIRNAFIRNFNPLDLRNDKGGLWENFLITERLKYLEYSGKWVNRFFWRTYAQQEIDYIEEYDGKLWAYELKWKSKNAKPPQSYIDNYPNSSYQIIDRQNYGDFLIE